MSSFSTGLYGSTISSIAGQLMQIERQPEAQLQQQQSLINSQVSALTSLSTQLTALYSSVNDLRDMLRTLQSNLLSLASSNVKGVGQYVNLQSMGIEMQNDGTLQINSAKLSNAMSSDFDDVQKFFQSISPAGWGQNAGMQLLKLTDPTLGPVGVDIHGLNQTNRNLTDQNQ